MQFLRPQLQNAVNWHNSTHVVVAVAPVETKRDVAQGWSDLAPALDLALHLHSDQRPAMGVDLHMKILRSYVLFYTIPDSHQRLTF